MSELKNGSHAFSKILMNAKKPMIILGANQLDRKDGARLLAEAQELTKVIGDKATVSLTIIKLVI